MDSFLTKGLFFRVPYLVVVLIFITITCNSISAQDIDLHNQEVYISLGKPTFADFNPNKNNYFVNAGYTKNLGRFISIGIEAEYAHGNNFPKNLNENDSGDLGLLNLSVFDLLAISYAETDILSSKLKVQIHAINNRRFRLTAFADFGYLHSWSTYFDTPVIFYDQQTLMVESYTARKLEDNYGNIAYGLGLNFDYKFKEYYVGFSLNSDFVYWAEEFGDVLFIEELAIYPNYYSAGIRFGYQW